METALVANHMEFDVSMQQIGRLMEISPLSPNQEGVYQWKHENHTYKAFQNNHQWYWEVSWGEPLSDTFEQRALLSKILQFNLKRMRFLSATLFLDPSMQQLWLQQILDPKIVHEQNLDELFNDFLLTVDVMEERFFPKSFEQSSNITS